VIGCSLSQNDFHLIDLLFKAHLERGAPLDIEIIAPVKVGEWIQKSYGFFPGLKTLTEIPGNLVSDPDPPNPFWTWLMYKSIALLGREKAGRTRHVKKVVR
jgi:hypothetical protein